jgi:hypothetical protein
LAARGLADPAIKEMLQRIRLVEAAELSRRFPAERLARLRIVLKSGHVAESDVSSARGDRRRPLTDADLWAKFDLYAALLGNERRAQLGHGCMTLAEGSTAWRLSRDLFRAHLTRAVLRLDPREGWAMPLKPGALDGVSGGCAFPR